MIGKWLELIKEGPQDASRILLPKSVTEDLVYDEAWHVVGASGEPAFQNSWVNYSTTYSDASFMRDSNGFVHITGLVKNGTAAPVVIFTLPLGYRPSHREIYAASGYLGHVRVDVLANGDVMNMDGDPTYLSLAGISFRAA